MSAFMAGPRSDYELLAIIDENSTWVVYGRQRRILSIAMNLREAVEQGIVFAQSRIVETISRQPSDNIIVHYEQAVRLRKLLAGLEVPAIKEAASAR